MRALLSLFVLVPLVAQGKNLVSKDRKAPSPTAARCGSGIAWHKDLAPALVQAEAEGKPVLWYVPTVAGSPMDRKAELDRYLAAGPFQQPEIVALVGARFVALKLVPKGPEQQQRQLGRGQFIEPGFLVLDAKGKELHRLDRLSTLDPTWLRTRLAGWAGTDVPVRELPPALAQARAALQAGDPLAAEKALLAGRATLPAAHATEGEFLLGAALARSARSAQAKAIWIAAAAAQPDDPWAWKCAAEAEGHGPFLRGFEDFTTLPPAVLTQPTVGTQAPEGVYTEDEIRRRCVRFLLGMQREHGGYDDSIYDFGGADSLPNVYVAGTAIVGWALLEEFPQGGSEAVEQAITRILAYVAADAHLNFEDVDEQLWAHVYRMHFAARLLDLRPAHKAAARALLAQAAAQAVAMQLPTGAFRHEYPNPFVMASTLHALKVAEAHGVELDAGKMQKAVRALLSCRAQNTGAFPYNFTRANPDLPVPGAAGRMPLCEHALLLWGESSAEPLRAAIEAAFTHHDQLESTRKYDNHANRLGYGGFFFWYDVQARTEAILALPAGEPRQALLARQREQVLAIPEIDGCFVDSHELGKSYGTAMGLLCLARLRNGGR